MIFLLLSAAMAGQNVQASVPNAQTDIDRAVQAMNDRLVAWSASIDPDGKLDSCKTITTSGDPELDTLACQAMSECAVSMRLLTLRLESPTLPESKKDKLAFESGSSMTTCVANRRSRLFRALAESRAAEGKN